MDDVRDLLARIDDGVAPGDPLASLRRARARRTRRLSAGAVATAVVLLAGGALAVQDGTDEAPQRLRPAEPAAAVVPFRALPPHGIPSTTSGPGRPTEPDCDVADLRLGPARVFTLAGSIVPSIEADVMNTSAAPCQVRPFDSSSAVSDEDGGVVAGPLTGAATAAGPLRTPEPAVPAGGVARLTGLFAVQTCPSGPLTLALRLSPQAPALTTTVSVCRTAPEANGVTGVSLTGVTVFDAQGRRVIDPRLSLEPTAEEVPETVPAGEPARFVIALRNPTDGDIALDSGQCPNYAVVGGPDGRAGRLLVGQLDCENAPEVVPAGGSIRFAMVVPLRPVPGPWRLTWGLASDGLSQQTELAFRVAG